MIYAFWSVGGLSFGAGEDLRSNYAFMMEAVGSSLGKWSWSTTGWWFHDSRVMWVVAHMFLDEPICLFCWFLLLYSASCATQLFLCVKPRDRGNVFAGPSICLSVYLSISLYILYYIISYHIISYYIILYYIIYIIYYIIYIIYHIIYIIYYIFYIIYYILYINIIYILYIIYIIYCIY